MKNSYRIALSLIALLIVVCDFIWLDFHQYNLNKVDINNDSLVIAEEKISINYLNGKNIVGNGELKSHFSITNTSDEITYYYINFMDVRNYNDTINYNLLCNIEDKNINDGVLNIGNNLIDSYIKIEPHETHSYDVVIKNASGLYLTLDIGNELIKEEAFNQILLDNNNVKEYITEPGKVIANTNEGLIKDIDDDGVTYYFRGDVTNNYVSFADKIWRIIRINGDGTIRIILNDSLGNMIYNNAPINEDKTINSNYLNSSIKNSLESLYDTEYKKYANYLEEGNFCADNSIAITEEKVTYFSSNSRNMVDKSPTFLCVNNAFKAYIGLITADEVLFAGGISNDENRNYYLFNSNVYSNSWTLSPAYYKDKGYPNIITINPNGGLINTIQSNNNLGVRPVINLRKNLMATGSGTIDDPYIISN